MFCVVTRRSFSKLSVAPTHKYLCLLCLGLHSGCPFTLAGGTGLPPLPAAPPVAFSILLPSCEQALVSCTICFSHQSVHSLREGIFVSRVQICLKAVTSPWEGLSVSLLPALPLPVFIIRKRRTVGTSCHLVSATDWLPLSLESLLWLIISKLPI